jgi:hypothetical protein
MVALSFIECFACVLIVALDQYIAACASNDYCRSDIYVHVFLGNGYLHLTNMYMVIFQEVLGEFLENDSSLMDVLYFWQVIPFGF